MNLQIETSGLELNSKTRDFIQRQVNKRGLRYEDRVRRIVIRLKDLNGPKGGNDKQAQVEIYSDGSPPVFVVKKSSHLIASINHALNRALRTVTRQNTKLRDVAKKQVVASSNEAIGSDDSEDVLELSITDEKLALLRNPLYR